MKVSEQALDALAEVALADEPVTSHEVAQQLDLDVRVASGLIILLRRARLIRRSYDPTHLRYVATSAGEDVVARHADEIFERAFRAEIA